MEPLEIIVVLNGMLYFKSDWISKNVVEFNANKTKVCAFTAKLLSS